MCPRSHRRGCEGTSSTHAWKLCATMKTQDVTDTLDLALQALGLNQAKIVHRPRLLFDNVHLDLERSSQNGSMIGRSSAGIGRLAIHHSGRTYQTQVSIPVNLTESRH